MTGRYRATFEVKTPVTETDYRAIVDYATGNYDKLAGFEKFKEYTKNHSAIQFRTKAIDLEAATMLKMRFGGKIETL
jgi:hypothetical protein